MTPNRHLKDQLFTHVATLTKAIASPKRLELIELLAQAPKTVEQLAEEAELSIALTSAHLKSLKQANLVCVTHEGKHRRYSLSNADVSQLWVLMHQLATQHYPALRATLDQSISTPTHITDVQTLVNMSQEASIQLIDVRPESEYQQAHIPNALSLPIEQLSERLHELKQETPIVAYCRGPFCLYARDAVNYLRQQGFNASQWKDGVAEYEYEQMHQLPLQP